MNTLFDKIWDAHVVTTVEDGPTQLYIDRLYCHEVTSPQAFAGLRERGIGVLRPEKVFCMPDHNTPTHDQDKEIEDPISKTQVDTLTQNACSARRCWRPSAAGRRRRNRRRRSAERPAAGSA